MREAFGDLFELPGDLLCITTNGMLNARGENVMGGGCAAQARALFPGINRDLGNCIATGGNRVHLLGTRRVFGRDRLVDVCSFPTKHHWAHDSDINLVLQSAIQLQDLIERAGYEDVLLPRPGCGLGGLEWDIVKPLLEDVLDDRVIIVAHLSEKPDAE